MKYPATITLVSLVIIFWILSSIYLINQDYNKYVDCYDSYGNKILGQKCENNFTKSEQIMAWICIGVVVLIFESGLGILIDSITHKGN